MSSVGGLEYMLCKDIKVYCKHSECPYKNCSLNQCNCSFEDFDKGVSFTEFGCFKYLDA